MQKVSLTPLPPEGGTPPSYSISMSDHMQLIAQIWQKNSTEFLTGFNQPEFFWSQGLSELSKAFAEMGHRKNCSTVPDGAIALPGHTIHIALFLAKAACYARLLVEQGSETLWQLLQMLAFQHFLDIEKIVQAALTMTEQGPSEQREGVTLGEQRQCELLAPLFGVVFHKVTRIWVWTTNEPFLVGDEQPDMVQKLDEVSASPPIRTTYLDDLAMLANPDATNYALPAFMKPTVAPPENFMN